MPLNNKRLFEMSGLIPYCPLCEHRYTPLEARLLDEKDDVCLMYVSCKKCRISLLALVIDNQIGVSSFCLVTELSMDDVIKFKDSSAISPDEVLELHDALQDNVFVNKLITN
jgi:hypothetical protein